MKAYFISAALVFGLVFVYCLNDKSTGRFAPEYHSMENATKLVVNVNDFTVLTGNDYINFKTASGLQLNTVIGSPIVEVDTLVNIAELIYVKEEIVVRVAENNRVSIIAGDNGEF